MENLEEAESKAAVQRENLEGGREEVNQEEYSGLPRVLCCLIRSQPNFFHFNY